jgi:DNA-binding HxlR family transcriptional regulator
MSAARIPDCPLARTVEVVGHWWTLEIVHEVLLGRTRFEAIRDSLGTPADVLRDRLGDLAAKGLLDLDGPDYRLTALGRSLRPVLQVFLAWGNHRLAPDHRSVVLVDAGTGMTVDPILVDRRTGLPLDTEGVVFARGPMASAMIAARYPEVGR